MENVIGPDSGRIIEIDKYRIRHTWSHHPALFVKHKDGFGNEYFELVQDGSHHYEKVLDLLLQQYGTPITSVTKEPE